MNELDLEDYEELQVDEVEPLDEELQQHSPTGREDEDEEQEREQHEEEEEEEEEDLEELDEDEDVFMSESVQSLTTGARNQHQSSNGINQAAANSLTIHQQAFLNSATRSLRAQQQQQQQGATAADLLNQINSNMVGATRNQHRSASSNNQSAQSNQPQSLLASSANDTQSIQCIATQATAAMAAAIAAQQLLASAAAICGMDLASLSNFAALASQSSGAMSQHQTPEQLMAAAVATAAFLSTNHHQNQVPEDLTVNQQQQQQQAANQQQHCSSIQLQQLNHHHNHHHHNNSHQAAGTNSSSKASTPVPQVSTPSSGHLYAHSGTSSASTSPISATGGGPLHNNGPSNISQQAAGPILKQARNFFGASQQATTTATPNNNNNNSLNHGPQAGLPVPGLHGLPNTADLFALELANQFSQHQFSQKQQQQVAARVAAEVRKHQQQQLRNQQQQPLVNDHLNLNLNLTNHHQLHQQHHPQQHQNQQQHQPQHQQQQQQSNHHLRHHHHLLGGHHQHSSIQTQQQLLATKGYNPMAVVVGSGQQTEILTPTHLRKAKLMFFYVRYPNSSTLKECFRDVRFNKNNTAQLVKWFSNFREFYYIQMEKYAREAVQDDRIQCKEDIVVTYDHELINQLNNHYNKNRHIELPEVFRHVVEETMRHFFDAIHQKRDQEQSWKKSIYKLIARLDQDVPEVFKTDAFNEHLE